MFGKWRREKRLEYRNQTERLAILTEFLSRPVPAACPSKGKEADPDILTAYNLAVEAALVSIRELINARPGHPLNRKNRGRHPAKASH